MSADSEARAPSGADLANPQTNEEQQFGALLIHKGLLTADGLHLALNEQSRSGLSLGRVLIDNALVSESDLVSTLANQLGLPFVDLSDYAVDATAVTLVSAAMARRYFSMPIGWDGGRLVVAMADPSNVVAIDDIRVLTGREVDPVLATTDSILAAIERYHRIGDDADAIAAQAASTHDDREDLTALQIGRASCRERV